MLFNDAQKLSFQDIKDSTGIEDKELRRTLQSLACGKVRVLQKVNSLLPDLWFVIVLVVQSNYFLDNQIPKGRDVDDEDSFVFNEEFSAPLYRIKVCLLCLDVMLVFSSSNLEITWFILLSGKCNSDEGDGGRKHKHHRKSLPGSSVSGFWEMLELAKHLPAKFTISMYCLIYAWLIPSLTRIFLFFFTWAIFWTWGCYVYRSHLGFIWNW